MNLRTVFTTATLALIGWVAVALASPRVGNVTSPGLTGYQLADNDDARHRDKDQDW